MPSSPRSWYITRYKGHGERTTPENIRPYNNNIIPIRIIL